MTGADVASRLRDAVRDSKIRQDCFSQMTTKSFSGAAGRDFPRYTAEEKEYWKKTGFHTSYDEVERWFHHYMEKEAPFLGIYRINTESESIIVRFKRNLPSFDGFWHINDLLSWVDDIEDFFEEIKPPEHLKCRIVWYKMMGAAYYWWKQLQDDRRRHGQAEIVSWTRMKKLLLNRFSPTRCLTKVHGEPRISKEERGHDSEILNTAMNETTNIGIDVLEKTSSHKTIIDEKVGGGGSIDEKVGDGGSNEVESSRDILYKIMPTRCLKEEVLIQDVVVSLKTMIPESFVNGLFEKYNLKFVKSINVPACATMIDNTKEQRFRRHPFYESKLMNAESLILNFDPGGTLNVEQRHLEILTYTKISKLVPKIWSLCLDNNNLHCVNDFMRFMTKIVVQSWGGNGVVLDVYSFCCVIHMMLSRFWGVLAYYGNDGNSSVKSVKMQKQEEIVMQLGFDPNSMGIEHIPFDISQDQLHIHAIGVAAKPKIGAEHEDTYTIRAVNSGSRVMSINLSLSAVKIVMLESIGNDLLSICDFITSRVENEICYASKVDIAKDKRSRKRFHLDPSILTFLLDKALLFMFDPGGEWQQEVKANVVQGQSGVVVITQQHQRDMLGVKLEQNNVISSEFSICRQVDSTQELHVNEVLEAAGNIYSVLIGELRLRPHHLLPKPCVIVIDDRGQLTGTTDMLYFSQVLILNLLIGYRIIIVGMMVMFDPGGARKISPVRKRSPVQDLFHAALWYFPRTSMMSKEVALTRLNSNVVDALLDYYATLKERRHRHVPIDVPILMHKTNRSSTVSKAQNPKLSVEARNNRRSHYTACLIDLSVVIEFFVDGNRTMTSLSFGKLMNFNFIAHIVLFSFDPGGVWAKMLVDYMAKKCISRAVRRGKPVEAQSDVVLLGHFKPKDTGFLDGLDFGSIKLRQRYQLFKEPNASDDEGQSVAENKEEQSPNFILWVINKYGNAGHSLGITGIENVQWTAKMDFSFDAQIPWGMYSVVMRPNLSKALMIWIGNQIGMVTKKLNVMFGICLLVQDCLTCRNNRDVRLFDPGRITYLSKTRSSYGKNQIEPSPFIHRRISIPWACSLDQLLLTFEISGHLNKDGLGVWAMNEPALQQMSMRLFVHQVVSNRQIVVVVCLRIMPSIATLAVGGMNTYVFDPGGDSDDQLRSQLLHTVYRCLRMIKDLICEQRDTGLNLIRVRAIREGWNDENLQNFISFFPRLGILWDNGLIRETSKLFHCVVNGLDPPMIHVGTCDASTATYPVSKTFSDAELTRCLLHLTLHQYGSNSRTSFLFGGDRDDVISKHSEGHLCHFDLFMSLGT